MLSSVPKSKDAVMCLTEKLCALDKLCLGRSYSAVGRSLMLVNQQQILRKASLNRNTLETRLCIDQLTKTLQTKARRNLTLSFL